MVSHLCNGRTSGKHSNETQVSFFVLTLSDKFIIILTLDLPLQRKILTLLASRKGVILASECSESFLLKIIHIAAIFDFNSSGRLERERNLYQGVSDSQKEG